MSCTVSTSADKRLYTVSFVSHAGHVPPAIYAAVNVSISPSFWRVERFQIYLSNRVLGANYTAKLREWNNFDNSIIAGA